MRWEDDVGTPSPEVVRLAELASARFGVMSDVQKARGMHDVVAASLLLPRRRRSRVGWWLGAAAAAALAVATTGVLLSLRARPLTYVVSEGTVQPSGYFHAAPGKASSIRFSDGTQLALMPGARGRVASLDGHGARVMLDDGEVRVDVVSRPDARWLFDAGPFSVHVHGTSFGLAWVASQGRLDLQLHRGAVTVTGPLSDGAIVLRPGQWLTVRLAEREVFVREFDSAAAPPLGGAVEEAASTEDRATTPAPPEASPLPAEGEQRRPRKVRPAGKLDLAWGPARSDNDWRRIFELAHRQGFERAFAERSSEDLALLADAAHYVGRDDIAERSLLAQRQRFGGTTRAKDAAFLLGRIVEDRKDGAATALTWYETHLREAPNGTYASEALGRKMTVLARLSGSAAARPVAEEYLRRYPGGSYAHAAHALTSSP